MCPLMDKEMNRMCYMCRMEYSSTLKKEGGWGYSSVGRVLVLQAQGPGFDPQHSKKIKNKNKCGEMNI